MFFHCFTVSFYSTDIWWFSQEGVILKIDLLGKGLTQGIRGDKGSPLMGSCAVFISFIPEQSYKAMSNCLSLLVLPIQFLFSLLFYFQLNRQPLLFPCVAGNNNESNWHTRTPTHGPFSSPEPTILLACGRNRELWEQPFQACAIDTDNVKPDGQNSLISFVISKWFLPELSIPAAGQKDRRLWGRKCLRSGQYLTRAHSHITRTVTAMDSCTVAGKIFLMSSTGT